MFKDKTLLITGGTGSFGHAVLDRFLETDIGEIRIFSRDEKKQDDMRHEYQSKCPELVSKISFYIGDVRDPNSINQATRGVDYLFHAAALKQVPSCEFFPMEAVKTNIEGTNNVLTSAISSGVKKIVCLSTDKAAYPINAMGMSKALMEKTFVARSRMVDPSDTTICGTRYGNVMYSRGSVIPLFVNQIREEKTLTVTSPEMTRFMMTLDEAVDLVIYAFKEANAGDIMVQKASASTIQVLAEALLEMFKSNVGTKAIGIRHGEKIHETLLTAEEYAHAIDEGSYFRVPADSRNLNYDNYLTKGNTSTLEKTYNSGNAYRLNKNEVINKLLEVPYIRAALSGDTLEMQ